MALKANLMQFLDDTGNELVLTEQAKTVFKFLTKIVSSVSEKLDYSQINKLSIEPLKVESLKAKPSTIEVNLNCNSRAAGLSCEGRIEAACIAIDLIEWHCDSCEAAGTIAGWQGTQWDKQKPTLH
ncbi:hypothetical protein [Colwellia echini]|uniref:Uncharacterized protein n=1 Tax=Colwellia echini TaxID=1982103 RepID=A0ABY3MY39_9GAMM|nr:hypothetical protein [Colwellia echini]TYK66140.1 hypothetical protein CWS31_007695 [Colwellia echini]